MAIVSASLVAVLTTLTAAEKLRRLSVLSPSDAAAIEMIIDNCLTYRWPAAHKWPALRNLRPKQID